jgi:hypothetical protein
MRGGGGGAVMRGGGAGAYSGGGQYSGRAATSVRSSGNTGTQAVNASGRNVQSGSHNRQTNVNRTNIDSSRDVNFNRNTVVRPATGGYARAPYAYGGRRFYGNHGYRYHGYRGYGGWGAHWHPVGAVVGAVAVGATAVAVANMTYSYYAGVWYAPYGTGYTVVSAPIGATVTTVPSQAVQVENNYYYYGGTYYEKEGDEYTVVPPEAGTVVENLPEGGEEVTVGDRKYVKFGETYYQPIEEDGEPMYEVVEVREGAGA